MTDAEQPQAFADDLDALVERYRAEFDMTFASVVGCLQFKAFTLMSEAQSSARDGEEGEGRWGRGVLV